MPWSTNWTERKIRWKISWMLQSTWIHVLYNCSRRKNTETHLFCITGIFAYWIDLKMCPTVPFSVRNVCGKCTFCLNVALNIGHDCAAPLYNSILDYAHFKRKRHQMKLGYTCVAYRRFPQHLLLLCVVFSVECGSQLITPLFQLSRCWHSQFIAKCKDRLRTSSSTQPKIYKIIGLYNR